MIGARLGHYDVLIHLGSGGMGDVYQATDSKLGRSVAIKVLPDALARDAERLARLEREARLLASLNHPNIAVIFGFEQSDGRHFLVMEFVDGETLADRIERGPIPLDEALEIAKQILEALEGAHDKGVIHRDLKPANVKINAEGKVKVLDFGLAKTIESESANPLTSNSPTLSIAATQAGLILGTASYMSPEQAKGRPVDRRTDIFAFGCILYEMITGRRAFDGEDVTEILGAVVRLEPDWSRLPDNTPPTIRRLLRLCLEKNAQSRRGAARDVRIDVEDALKEPEAVTSATPVSAPARKPWVAWTAAAVFLVAAVVLGIPYFRSTPASPIVRFQVAAPAGGAFTGIAPGLQMEVSPNGTHLAFAAAAQGKPDQIFIRSLDAVEAHAVPGTEGATGPFWSPDGRFVAFFANGQLKKVDITGGPVQTLCTAPGGAGGLSGTWNSAGVIVFGSQTAGGLYRTPAEGGRPTQLTSINAARGELAHLMPQFLPDGNHFLYVVQASKVETSGLYAAALDSKETKRILQVSAKAEFVPPDHLLLARGGALFRQSFSPGKLTLSGEATRIAENVPINEGSARAGFSVAPNVLVHGYGQTLTENSDLSWYDRTGKLLMHVGTASYTGIDLWKDKRLAAHYHNAATGGGDIWITDLERGTPTRFTFDASEDSSSPIWSPDGTSVAFSAVRNGRFGLYRRASSGVGPEELLYESETPNVPTSWAPDGKSLVFVNYDPKTQADLWILPLVGDRKPIVYLKSPVSETHAQISPDGRWIAYSSGVSFATRNLWIQSYPNPGTKWQVSTNGGTVPRWGADGKELFYSAAGGVGGTLWSVAVGSNGPSLTFGVPKHLFDPGFLVILHPPYPNYFNYAVSPDGQKLLIPRAQSITDSADQPHPLTVVLNWTTLLEK